MPEPAKPREHLHPASRYREPLADGTRALSIAPYAELQVASNFTFLTGASHPEELVQRAAALGYRAMALTDRHSLAGVVRAHVAAKQVGLQLVVGCRLDLVDSELTLLVYPTDVASYGCLCRLLTVGNRRGEPGDCVLTLEDVRIHSQGLLVVVVPQRRSPLSLAMLAQLRAIFDDDRLSLAVAHNGGGAAPRSARGRIFRDSDLCPDYYEEVRVVCTPDSRSEAAHLKELARQAGIPLVAIGDIRYHVSQRRMLADVLACVREHCTLDEAGWLIAAHGERYLKAPAVIEKTFAQDPELLARSVAIARRAQGFSLDQLTYVYPSDVCEPGLTPMAYLEKLTWQGARSRYPEGVSTKVRAQLEHELHLIAELGYAPYFLTVYDIVEFARAREILCQGRGAAANSAVCFCLGLTAVDPQRIAMLFERFISRERNEPPDIDIDFEHERREEVIQYIYRKYGRERAALCAEVVTYRWRSAVRDVGKALGLSLDAVEQLSSALDWWEAGVVNEERLRELGFDSHNPTMTWLIALTGTLLGFPRHLAQHVGGFVITAGALCELVPVRRAAMDGRTLIEWDKDDLDAMGMLKIDVLGLGMLTCIRKAFALVKKHWGRTLTLASVPAEEARVYDMVARADTVGVFQIESRAQMAMLPRLRPACFYDLVIEIAIVRPGPIQGDMVHPYLRRRNGEEAVTYPNAAIECILGKTLGVPLFQEQVMALAVTAAGFTPGEADGVRRAMAAWKRKGGALLEFYERLVSGMRERGYSQAFAEQCFTQIKGFSEYGFPESHAASFALLVYVSAWLKCYYPAAYTAALLNSQPMGFYGPAQLVRDLQSHGVKILPASVGASHWEAKLESHAGGLALRLGLQRVKGLRRSDADKVLFALRNRGPFCDVAALWRASGVGASALRQLARADAFGRFGLTRQQALWAVAALRDEGPLFKRGARARARGARQARADAALPAMAPLQQVVSDYRFLGLSLKAHPMVFLRPWLQEHGVVTADQLAFAQRFPQGARVAVAGLVLGRQRPVTAGGVVFMTLEDERANANLVVHERIYVAQREVARFARVVLARGHIERAREVVHVVVRRLEDLSERLASLVDQGWRRDFR